MNNNERLVDDNSTVSIPGNETTSPVERKKVKKEKKSGITIRELTIIGLLAGITIALGVSGYGIICYNRWKETHNFFYTCKTDDKSKY